MQASELDWTIVRPSAFTDTAGDKALRIDFPPTTDGLAFTVAKDEVAELLVDQLDSRRHMRHAVGISR